jgi:DNA-binding CsgD family transcriptional regulator
VDWKWRIDGDVGLFRDLAEFAVEAEDCDAFRSQVLAKLIRTIGADTASFSCAGADVMEFSATLAGTHHPATELRRCIEEISPLEIQRALALPTHEDSEVIAPGRRDQLSLYRDFLPDLGVNRFVARGWSADGRIYFVSLARTGPHDRRRFLTRAARILDGVFPIIALGERAQRGSALAPPCWRSERLAMFTSSERRVVEMLERGMTNREIASLLGLSPNTVRNRIASAFRRVGATRRAELVYLLRAVD